jgi:molybdenum cofactor cytidylyltransferase
MGRNKMLLAVDGVPMVRRAVQQASEAGLSPVVVVVGHEEPQVRAALDGLACVFAVNGDYTGPTSTSLHAGLRALDVHVSAVVILLGDMVRVTSAMLTALTVAARETGAPLAVSRYGDVLAPPLLFQRELWSELLAWHGEGCGKAVVKRHQQEATMIDWPESALRDVDTPDDYRELVTS